ncbi:MAG: peptide chain release factor N(5)-glutamine methyltransferase [Mucilaginibacter sp.]
METVKDVFNKFREALAGLYDTREIEAISLTLLAELTQLSKASIKAFPEKVLEELVIAKLSEILTELQTGKPLQYIFGETEFYGLKFKVNPSVLIPRPETEELVEWALSSVGARSLNILDIGTGSGCIAVSLKKNLPDAHVTAIDISAGALETAKQNAELNKVDVDFIEADILNISTSHSLSTTHYSLIISNPPYVTPTDKEQMHVNVTNFEPHTALFVTEDDPLLFYKAIADFAKDHLTENSLLFFEINESYGKETVDMLSDKLFKNIELRKDMSGRDRMVKAVV